MFTLNPNYAHATFKSNFGAEAYVVSYMSRYKISLLHVTLFVRHSIGDYNKENSFIHASIWMLVCPKFITKEI